MTQPRNTTAEPTVVADALAQQLLGAYNTRKAAAAARGLTLEGVTAWSTSGPSRVVVKHTCGHTHDRAVQDLFQVTVCRECKTRADKAARKGKRAAKVARLATRVRELEALLAEQAK